MGNTYTKIKLQKRLKMAIWEKNINLDLRLRHWIPIDLGNIAVAKSAKIRVMYGHVWVPNCSSQNLNKTWKEKLKDRGAKIVFRFFHAISISIKTMETQPMELVFWFFAHLSYLAAVASRRYQGQ